jgi:hypothetical protein
MFEEELFAAFGVAGCDSAPVVDGDQFGQTHVIEERIAAGDVEDVDARSAEGAAVELDLQFGPVGVAASNGLGLDARAVDVEADLALQGLGSDPAGEAVRRVRLESYVGVQAGVGVAASDDADRLLAAVKLSVALHDRPRGALVGLAVAVVAALPAHGQTVAAADLEAGVREQVRAFAVDGRAVDFAEKARRLAQPLVALVRGVAHDAGHDRLDLFRLRKLGELHERGEFRQSIGIADDG